MLHAQVSVAGDGNLGQGRTLVDWGTCPALLALDIQYAAHENPHVTRRKDANGADYVLVATDFPYPDGIHIMLALKSLGAATQPPTQPAGDSNATKWVKVAATPKDRAGMYADVEKVVGVRGPLGKDLLHDAPPPSARPEGMSLGEWFTYLLVSGARLDANGETFLLFRSRYVDDNDLMWIERIERDGNHFTIRMKRAIWQGTYHANVTYHSVYAVNLGKLPADIYAAEWIIEPLEFTQLDKDGWPADAKADPKDKPTTLRFAFGYAPATRPATAERVLAVNLDGRKTEDGWTYSQGLSEPDWSPDGKWIAFTKHLQVYRPEHMNWHGTYETWVASAEGNTVRKIARGLKLFWDGPTSLTFAYWTEEGEKTVGHFAAYDVARNKQVELPAKPGIPSVRVLLEGRGYSILATSARNERVADPGRKEMLAALQERLPHSGRLGGDIAARDGVLLLSRSYLGPPDAPSGRDIWHVPTDDPGQARVLIPNASDPALSPNHLTVAYIRDGNLWISRVPHPLPVLSPTQPATQPADRKSVV